MRAQILTFHVTYKGLEDKIWRDVQVSSTSCLDQLCYLVLAAFDTMAYHLFDVQCGQQHYQLPDEDLEEEDFLDVGVFHLYQFKLKPGDEMTMNYDFGVGQVFRMVLVSAEPMPTGGSKHYPIIADGAGSGILDDLHVSEMAELVAQIDARGCTDTPVFYQDREEPWDYRRFDLKEANAHLKERLREIADGYASLWDIYDEEDE